MDVERKTLFEDVKVSTAVLNIAIPTVISQLIDIIYNMADVFFLGRTSNPYMMAGVLLSSTLLVISVPISNVFGIGGGSLIARMMGKKDKRTQEVSSYCCYISLIVSCLYSLVISIFAKPLLLFLGASRHTLLYALSYTKIVVVYGMPFAVLTKVMSHLFRNACYAKEAGIGLSGGGILNIILDPFFMFYLFPNGKEVEAAATATLVSTALSFGYYVYVMHKVSKDGTLSIKPRDAKKITKKQIKLIFDVGIPSGTLPLLYDVMIMFANALMAAHGDIQLAAFGIAMKVDRISSGIGIGLSQATLPIVAYNYTAKNVKRLTDTIKTSRKMGIIFLSLSVMIIFLLAPYISRIFINVVDDNSLFTYQLTTIYLRLRTLVPIFMFLNYHSSYCMQAVGAGTQVFIHQFIRIILLDIPVMIIFNMLFGDKGVGVSLMFSECFAAIVAYLMLKKEILKRTKEQIN